MTLLEKLKNRGFIEQVSDPYIEKLLEERKITCYIGFDPTADSLHVGNLVPIMLLKWFEVSGHRPIALIGGGTALIGDPSGKTEMRKLISKEQIDKNSKSIEHNLKQFLDIPKSSSIRNNYDWLGNLNYIKFLRKIGIHFSVNRMIAAEAYKQRLEKGLSFIEFNYQILQAYDFLKLFEEEDCILQMGGNDQWGNIVAGIDLIRRVHQKDAYAITVPLMLTASGQKMGKTENNAIWLSENKLDPYHYYQFWINTDDRDVKRFLFLYTFLEEDYINDLTKKEGEYLNDAKRVLAYEATKLCHGEEAAKNAELASKVFKGQINEIAKANLPSIEIRLSLLKSMNYAELFFEVGLSKSKSEAKRLIKGGGAYIENKKIERFDKKIDEEYLNKKDFLLRAGKKKYMRIVVLS